MSKRYDEDEIEEMYDEALDELGDVTIGGHDYSHSIALKRVDPVAYRVGLADYASFLEEDEEEEDGDDN